MRATHAIRDARRFRRSLMNTDPLKGQESHKTTHGQEAATNSLCERRLGAHEAGAEVGEEVAFAEELFGAGVVEYDLRGAPVVDAEGDAAGEIGFDARRNDGGGGVLRCENQVN